MFVTPSDQAFWNHGQEKVSAKIQPPPGLDWGTERTDPLSDKFPAMVTIDKTDSVSGASSEAEQPMKVKLAGDLSGKPELVAEAKVAALAVENESLASVNAQLVWDNAMLLQHYGGCGQADDVYAAVANAEMQQQWQMQQSWSPPSTEPGDIVYFHGLQNATELNEQYGTVDRWDADSQRWVVRLATGEEKFTKPENLMVVRGPQQQYSQQWCPSMYGMQQYPQAYPKAKSGRANKKNAAAEVRDKTWSFGSDSTAASMNEQTEQSGEGGRTTVMMRNIPNDYSGEMLLALLDEHGFEGCYKLVYLPMDYHCKAGLGYAFIDLTTPEEAERFRQVFEGFCKWKVASAKKCSVGWSTLQGVQAHVDRYRNSPVMHDEVPTEFKPMLFENGRPVQLPPPTKSIRAPRVKKAGGHGQKGYPVEQSA